MWLLFSPSLFALFWASSTAASSLMSVFGRLAACMRYGHGLLVIAQTSSMANLVQCAQDEWRGAMYPDPRPCLC
ncbi:hypothetical protein OH77DRAFT_1430039 [Trametes cingulata]|nr:hypothetical protein OH77DRAFT_1430039 [Trametes cingulata]